MRKSKYYLLGAFCTCLALGVAVGCGDNDDDKKTSETPNEIILADFEKWAPDFQTIRLRNEFGSVDVNTNAAYVKSGKQSAALTVVGAEGAEKPLFFVNTVSGRFDYDYSDFSKIDSVSAWLYNASQTDETVYVGLITSIVSIEQVGYEKYETFTLKSGWNEVVYKPDMNYVISAVGQEEYDGIKGVYFMFDNPHAATKAEGKKFYVDDVKLNYGEEKPFSEVRAGKYYTSGTQIGAPNYITLKNPVTMKELEDKALSFEFKFDTDTGRFGFAIMCDDYNWNNITGTLVIEKTADGVVANMGRIEALEDGWYVWKLNQEFFAGDGAGKAESVSLIYHQGEVVQGNVIINWNSMKAVGAYEPTREESAEKFTDGGRMFHYFYEKGIPMSELKGKALQFEFKFVSDTGKFGFTFMDDKRDWANITGELVIEKTADGVVSNLGKIEALEDGWYAWRLNSDLFAGDGATRAEIADLAFTNQDSVIGTVYLDWSSLKAVDAYTVTREEKASRYADGTEVYRNFESGISMTALEGKALHFEFKFMGESGKFVFAFMDGTGEWKNITGKVVIEKTSDGRITANIGRIVDGADGWTAWELNKTDFGGGQALLAAAVNLIDPQGEKVVGGVLIDWDSMEAVNAYACEPVVYASGEKIEKYLNYGGVSFSKDNGKALHFEFKFTGTTGKFGFTFIDNHHTPTETNPDQTDWYNLTGAVVITKTAEGVTANIGKITAVEGKEGWYAWELNSDLFAGDGAARADMVNLVTESITVEGGVSIDWHSLTLVDAYELTREERAEQFTDGDKIEHNFRDSKIPMTDLQNKALSFEFKFATETGKFGFNLEDMNGEWKSITGDLIIKKTAKGVSANMGVVTAMADGWYQWKLNRNLFAGHNVANAESVNLAYHYGIEVEGTVYVDWNSFNAVDAYSVENEKLDDSYFDGFEGTGDGCVLRVKDWTETELSDAEKRSGAQSFKIHVKKNYSSVVLKLDTDMIAAMINPSQLTLWVNVASGTCGNLIGSVYKESDGDYLGSRATVEAGENGTWRKITFSAEQVQEIKTIGAVTLYFNFGSDGSGIAYVDDLELTVTDPDVKMSFEDKTDRYVSGTKVELADFANTEKFEGVDFNKLTITCNGEVFTCSLENNKMFFAPDKAGRYVFEYTHMDGHKIAKATQVVTVYEPLADPYVEDFEGGGRTYIEKNNCNPIATVESGAGVNNSKALKVQLAQTDNTPRPLLVLDDEMKAKLENAVKFTLQVRVERGNLPEVAIFNLRFGNYKAGASDDQFNGYASGGRADNIALGNWYEVTYDGDSLTKLKETGVLWMWIETSDNGGRNDFVFYLDDLTVISPDPDFTISAEDKNNVPVAVGESIEIASFTGGFVPEKLSVTLNGNPYSDYTLDGNKLSFVPMGAGEYNFVYTYTNGYFLNTATQKITVIAAPLADPKFDGFEGMGNASVIKTLNGATTELSKEEKHSGNQSLKVSVTAGYDSIVIGLDTDMIAAMTGSSQLSLWVYGAEGSCSQIIVSDYNSEDGWKLGGNKVTWSAVENGSWHKITFSVGQTAAIKSVGAITLCCDGTTNFVAYVDDIEITEQKTIVMDFETGDEEMYARSYAGTVVSTVEISEEQANSGTKSIKVFQNQHGALVLKLSQEMIDAIDESSTLTVRYMIASSDKDQTTAWMNFFSATAPNSETDKQDPGYSDCKISEGGVDSGSVAINNEWKSKEISGELLASIKENGYLWMNVSVTDFAAYTFYVDYITLE